MRIGCDNETIVCFELKFAFDFHKTFAFKPFDVHASVISTSTDKFDRKSRELLLPTNILSHVKLPKKVLKQEMGEYNRNIENMVTIKAINSNELKYKFTQNEWFIRCKSGFFFDIQCIASRYCIVVLSIACNSRILIPLNLAWKCIELLRMNVDSRN